jgi:hypothetical protein
VKRDLESPYVRGMAGSLGGEVAGAGTCGGSVADAAAATYRWVGLVHSSGIG